MAELINHSSQYFLLLYDLLFVIDPQSQNKRNFINLKKKLHLIVNKDFMAWKRNIPYTFVFKLLLLDKWCS